MTTVPLGLPTVPRRGVPRPDGPTGLVDRFGRIATDLRVSLTDRCNLRCTYCMPAEGLDWLPHEQVLTDDEVIRLITVAVERLGVRDVRFTGGEPLLRRGLERILTATTALRRADGSAPVTALTTNGLGLARRAGALRAAGLGRVNVSLDTLDPDRFARITRRDRLPDVLAGLAAARDAGLDPVKVNAVLMPEVNDDEAAPLLRWAVREGYELRFIEQMPLDPQGGWDRASMVTADDILARLRQEFDLSPQDGRGSAPAQTWFVNGTDEKPGGPRPRVGVIASVTRPFCGDCDRTRLTADGQIRDCLFARHETDLRAVLRGGGSDEDLAAVWRGAMWEKQPGHGIDDPTFLQPDRPMSAIGG
jgi:cyclic pyranopterin phosphate synthase